jgi:hypothetical protein
MRPKIAIWSDYGVPTQKHWRSPYRQRRRSSIGPKILLIASVFVGGVIGGSGLYPQIIDSEWVQNAATHAKRAVADATTTRRSTIVAAIPLSPHRTVTTTGEAAVSGSRPAAPAPVSAERSQVRSSVAAVALPPNETKPPLADVPDAQAVADPPADAAPATATDFESARRFVARAPVAKKRVVRTVHHRGYSGAYAQYGGWGGRGGWGRGMGSSYRL